jgi:GT2 family glycosyltransferase
MLYILIVNFNGHKHTIECLESVLKSTYTDFRIIVIDNSPDYTSLKALENWATGNNTALETLLPQYVLPTVVKPLNFDILEEEQFAGSHCTSKLIFVKAKQNKGFAAANNIGLNHIKQFGKPEDIIWLLNNDTVIQPEVAGQIISLLKKQADINIYGTPLIEYYSPLITQAIGGRYNTKTGLSYNVGEGLDKSVISEAYIQSQHIDYPIGASIIIKKGFLDSVGLMEESYFLYHEELDWSYRAKNAGGKVIILPVNGIYHKQGETLVNKKQKRKPEFADLAYIRSRLKFAKKFNSKNYFKIRFFILTLTVSKRMLAGNFKVIPKIIRVVFKEI